ncbi:MAG: phytanoyl-CoA dioxygenase family protein [Gammaproteobacteria bacterium]|nr:phytanoyl-CoA dioxygenase family protein [Gammaproteobacteria bacterium]
MKVSANQHLDQLRTDGYTIIENLLSANDLNLIRSELDPWLQGHKFGRNDFEGFRTERVYALLAKAPSVAKIIEHEAVLALLDALLPRNYLLSSALVINVHPGETAQNFHIDDAAGSDTWFKKPRPWLGISTIWAFDDFTADNGATEVIPGSHLWDENRTPAAAEALPVIMPAGSVMVFAGNLCHRGGANNSNGTRMAITPQYCMPWLRQLEHMALVVPPAAAGQYSERIQELLGYSIIDPGFMGFVDGRHPKHLINNDYRGRKHRDDLPTS